MTVKEQRVHCLENAQSKLKALENLAINMENERFKEAICIAQEELEDELMTASIDLDEERQEREGA